MTETLAGMEESGPIGRSIRRLEDGRLLRGQGGFVDDLAPEGGLFVAMLRSPVASGRITAVDVSAAGARAAFTAADLEATCAPLVAHISRPGVASPPRPILAADRVRFVGELVAAVVAGDRYAAADAVEAIRLDIEPATPVLTFEEALAEGAPAVDEAVAGNLFFLGTRSSGDVAGAFSRADEIVECEVDHPRLSAAPIECRGVVAAPAGDGVTVWTSTQVPHLVADAVAECLHLDRSRVRVVAADVGGGFGIKAQVYPEEVLLAWIARRLKAPVKWVETRSEHMQAASHARDQRIRLSAAVRRDGRVLGLRAKVWSSIGAYGIRPFGPLLDPLGTAGMIPGPYDIRDYEYETFAVATNKCPEGPYRGVGIVTAALAHERLMDAVAARMQLDPADVRRVNFIRREQMPYTSVTGHPYESGDYAAALDAALGAFDYAGARDEQRRARAGGRCVGVGIGSYVEYTGAGSSTFAGRGMADIPGVDTARAWRAADGRIHVQTSCAVIGQGSHTTLAQVAAAGFGVEPEAVVVEQTDTAAVGPGTGTFMSRGSVTAATAVFRAASLLRELEAENGDLDVTVTYDPPQASHPYATHVCMVEVDRETGDPRILRYAVAEDCGVLINPMIVEGQVVGGVAQGIGAALFEEVAYGADGQLRSGTFADYLIPSAGEIPPISIRHLHTPSTVHELGTKGAGEGGTIGATAAVANAIADALGLTDISLPLTPERVHGA
ncbi:MAG TPA: xanthine dehydrogenase family protein molybdopterin-binding subunit [Candidatus Dormibacteraeota bacterium]|nr:xanthine dehydrogenase family protein molybdopterin-binding subunit [Candidatus Dormibacteraeota bacterium]